MMKPRAPTELLMPSLPACAAGVDKEGWRTTICCATFRCAVPGDMIGLELTPSDRADRSITTVPELQAVLGSPIVLAPRARGDTVRAPTLPGRRPRALDADPLVDTTASGHGYLKGSPLPAARRELTGELCWTCCRGDFRLKTYARTYTAVSDTGTLRAHTEPSSACCATPSAGCTAHQCAAAWPRAVERVAQ